MPRSSSIPSYLYATRMKAEKYITFPKYKTRASHHASHHATSFPNMKARTTIDSLEIIVDKRILSTL